VRGHSDRETEVTRVLIEHAGLIQSGLQRIGNRPFGRQTAGEIVELHGHVARDQASNRRRLPGFVVSKYLHFQCPIVPIYHSNAQAAIGQFVECASVSPIREALTAMLEWARAYRTS
jgi:hypothetical protein